MLRKARGCRRSSHRTLSFLLSQPSPSTFIHMKSLRNRVASVVRRSSQGPPSRSGSPLARSSITSSEPEVAVDTTALAEESSKSTELISSSKEPVPAANLSENPFADPSATIDVASNASPQASLTGNGAAEHTLYMLESDPVRCVKTQPQNCVCPLMCDIRGIAAMGLEPQSIPSNPPSPIGSEMPQYADDTASALSNTIAARMQYLWRLPLR